MIEEYGTNFRPFTTAGEWWLPGRSDMRVPGTLTFNSEGRIVLALIGRLDAGEMPALLRRYPVVLGTTRDGKDMTLCKNLRVGGRSGESIFGGSAEETLDAGSLYVGAQLPKGHETRFEAVSYRFSNAPSWSALDTVATPEVLEGRWRVTLAESKYFVLDLPIGKLQINVGLAEEYGRDSARFDRGVGFHVELPEPMTNREIFQSTTRPLQHLLSFACDAPCHVTRRAYSSSEFNHKLPPGNPLPLDIALIHRGDTEAKESQEDFRMLFTLSDIEEDVEAVFTRWNEMWSVLAPALDLMFGTQLGPMTYADTRFLLLAQAAEVYARLRFPELHNRTPEHDERRLRVLEAVDDPEDNRWLREALHYFKEPTFAELLSRLIQHTDSYAFSFVRKDFPEVVKCSRNYYTHYDDKSKEKAVLETVDLSRLAEEVFALLQLCLLRDIGFDDWKSGECLRRTQRWQMLAHSALPQEIG